MKSVIRTYRLEIVFDEEDQRKVRSPKFNMHLMAGVIRSLAETLGRAPIDIDGSLIDINKPDDVFIRDLENRINSMGHVSHYVASILSNSSELRTSDEKIKALEGFIFDKVNPTIDQLRNELRTAREGAGEVKDSPDNTDQPGNQ